VESTPYAAFAVEMRLVNLVGEGYRRGDYDRRSLLKTETERWAQRDFSILTSQRFRV
jgi:hypothetical protein